MKHESQIKRLYRLRASEEPEVPQLCERRERVDSFHEESWDEDQRVLHRHDGHTEVEVPHENDRDEVRAECEHPMHFEHTTIS